MNVRTVILGGSAAALLALAACGQQEEDAADAETEQPAETASVGPGADDAADPAQTADASDWTHPVTEWGDPDLQGTWPIVHLLSVPLQRPEEYGERRYLTEEEFAERQERMDAREARYETEAQGGKLGIGHWAEDGLGRVMRQTSLIIDPPNGRLPEMTDEGKRRSALLGSTWQQRPFLTTADFDNWDRCITRGLPASMFPFHYNNGIQVIQAPGYVILRLEMIHEARIIPVDGRPPLHENIKQWIGESRGHWEGDTLVIETTNFNGEGTATNFGTPGSPRGNDSPISTEMKLTERLTRTGPDTLTYQITVDDPVVWESSWTAELPWLRDNDYQMFEYACHEDNTMIRNYINAYRAGLEHEAAEGGGG